MNHNELLSQGWNDTLVLQPDGCVSPPPVPQLTTNDVSTGEQSGLTNAEMRLLGCFSVFFFFFCFFRSLRNLQSVWVRSSMTERGSKWGMLDLVSLLIVSKRCISEECVVYSLGVGEGRDESGQVHLGRKTNDGCSLLKRDPCCG